MATTFNNPSNEPEGQGVSTCGLTSNGIVVPPREVFLLAGGAAVAGLLLLAFSVLLAKRLNRD